MKPNANKHSLKAGARSVRRSSADKKTGKPIKARPPLDRNSNPAVIRLKELKDGQWYRGIGRNSSFGRWDATSFCFWVVVFNDFADPVQFPDGSTRQVRLKQEHYFAANGGTFKPLKPV